MSSTSTPEITPEMLQQNPALAGMLVFMAIVMFSMLVGSLVSWGWIFYRTSTGSPVLELKRPWEPRQWSLLDLVFIVLLGGGIQLIVAGALLVYAGNQSEEPGLEVMAVSGFGTLVAVAGAAAWIWLRYRVSPGHMGFGSIGWRSMGATLLIGLAALPVVYLLMAVISMVSAVEYNHPLIESAADSATLSGYLMACFAAAVAAPIAEEFLFRVLLQGWLQSIPFKSFFDTIIGAIPPEVRYSPVNSSSNEGQLEHDTVAIESSNESPNGDSPIVDAVLESNSDFSTPATQPGTPAGEIIPPIWPAVVVGILFGFAHYDYGLSFIPLSILGILLGLVYRQTHAIWPCILIHGMLNSTSMLALGRLIMLKNAGVE